jgi:hypothetical protein
MFFSRTNSDFVTVVFKLKRYKLFLNGTRASNGVNLFFAARIGNWKYPEFLKIGIFASYFEGGVWISEPKSKMRGSNCND